MNLRLSNHRDLRKTYHYVVSEPRSAFIKRKRHRKLNTIVFNTMKNNVNSFSFMIKAIQSII